MGTVDGTEEHATQSIGGGEPGRDGDGFAPGELIGGRYRVERLLGRGGMGEVYQVLDESLAVRVALKIVRGRRAGDAREQTRLQRELRLARKITHAGICRIYDLAMHGESALQIPFITMELVAGETLAQRLRRDGPLPHAEALALADQLAAAIAAAHHAGVIHCDLTSNNILLAGERTVITDFGVSQLWRAEAAGAARAGTPAYMAPEQERGGTLSPAVDVYAFGVVLHELVSGRLPPPVAAGLDPRWARVIRRCLSADPKRRFQDAAAIPRALRGRRRAAAALGAVLAVAAGAFLLVPRAASPGPGDAAGCGYQGPVVVEELRDRAAFERAAGSHRVVDFDDVDTRDGPVALAEDRYAESFGVVLRGSGGQWADRDFGYPADYASVSRPNSYAPGPRAPREAHVSGGHDTDVTFRDRGAAACVSAVGAMFIDADFAFPGEPSGLAIYDRRGALLGSAAAQLRESGTAQFVGLIARDAEGRPVAAIARAHLVNGNGWPNVDEAEGVVIDDLALSVPRAQ